MRKLASIQIVKQIESIKGAKTIEKAYILGWQCIVKKGEFKEGDRCVYFEIDSILPPWEQFEFMESRKYRVKTAKFMGFAAQGLALPITAFPNKLKESVKEGDDVTDILDVVKHDPELATEKAMAAQAAEAAKHGRIYKYFLRYKWFRKLTTKRKGGWPDFLKKTDETRIQSSPSIVRRFKDLIFYRTEKLDGQSATFAMVRKKFLGITYKTEEFVCSRNIWLKRPTTNNYWSIFYKKNIRSKLRRLGGNYAIQGEIVGPAIQKNKYRLNELDFYAFNIYDIDKGENVPYDKFITMCAKVDLQHVPIRDEDIRLPGSMTDIVELSKSRSTLADIKQEGDVWRLKTDSRISFKCVNPEFLLKWSL